MTSASKIVRDLLEDLEPTGTWPEDFKTVLFDYLEPLGYSDLPSSLPVKKVPVAEFLDQAITTEYHPGDERNHPDYLSDLKAYRGGGGEFPPIIIDGNRLIDGRHRLLALDDDDEDTIKAIDLQDLRSKHESTESSLTRQAITAAIQQTLKSYTKERHVKTAYDVGSGACEDFAEDVREILLGQVRHNSEELEAIGYDNLTGRLEKGVADGKFYTDTLQHFGVKLPPGVTVDLLNKSELGEAGTHCFLRWKSPQGYLYFDAEAPRGVDSPFSLPFAQRYLNIARLHSWK